MFDKDTKLTYEKAMKRLSPIKKVDFKRWHSEGEFRLIGAGHYKIPIVVEALSDYGHPWLDRSSSTSRGPDMHKHEKAYMFSNGVQEFVLVVNDMQASEYSKQVFEETGNQHVILYLVAGKEGSK